MSDERTTNQKIKILEYVRSVNTHPNAEEVYLAVKHLLPAISLATVYRNLNNLSQKGEILKLEINGEFRFDANMCGHMHCICKNCGKIIDIENALLVQKVMISLKSDIKHEDFTPECVSIISKGLCKPCRRA